MPLNPSATLTAGADNLRQLELPPPKGLASWDGASLAAALGASDDAVWRLLRREGVQFRRQRSWCISTDPQFAANAADIIGLYLNPPQNALVLSVFSPRSKWPPALFGERPRRPRNASISRPL